MPLIRIIIRNPSHDSEGAFALSQQLESQGFQVEIASPDDAPFGPADLEIALEILSQREALDRAAELAARLQADVVVFPGALPHVAEIPIAFADPAATEVIEVPAEAPPQRAMEVPVSSEPDTPRLSFLESFGGGLKASSEHAGPALD